MGSAFHQKLTRSTPAMKETNYAFMPGWAIKSSVIGKAENAGLPSFLPFRVPTTSAEESGPDHRLGEHQQTSHQSLGPDSGPE